jgi:hypothetical protein
MPRDLKPIPRNPVEVEQDQITPYLTQGKPDSNEETFFSRNRARDISRKNDKIKDISIGLEDIDQAMQYYFDNVLKPTVVQNGNRRAVPVIFGDPEKWKAVQSDGYYRDAGGKIMAPLIMYKRTDITKNRTLGNKLDGNKVHNFQVFETRYNQKDQYNQFSILTNTIPSKQYYVSVVPDYVDITYQCVLFTNFVEQNNKLIEAVQFASDSYWGNLSRWQFRTKVDSFSITNEYQTENDRTARTDFTLTLNGYLIPDTVNKEMAASNMFYSPSQIIFGLEVVGNTAENFNAASQIAASQGAGQTSFVGGGTNIINNIYTAGGGASTDSIYLNTNITKVANTVTTTTATFIGASLLQPSVGSTLPATSVSNFTFYVNGQNIPSSYITLFEGGGSVTLTFNTGSVGYALIPTDEVTAVGKFA